MGKKNFEELRDDAAGAFEESTGDLPSDVEMGIMSAGAREMVNEEKSD